MNTPYLQVVESTRRMAGKGAPRDTTFGVLGHTGESPLTRSLGGLVKDSKSKASPAKAAHKMKKDTTEHQIGGGNDTFIPGKHSGQVPYPGQYMKQVGAKVD